MSDLVALRNGTMLVDDYRIERVLGAGGFGITYLAEEVPLARLVTIKEYFPIDFAARDHVDEVVPRSEGSAGDYAWGLDRFLAEAQTLARFNHPNIVRVYRFFQARNTGYIVLHYEEGQSLKGWLKGLGRAPRQHELDRLIEPLLDALETVHAADYLHRDIAPDNIMIRRDGSPVLIDFGSARGDIAKHSKTISALVKPGYSPYEQYATTSRQQGPWTDIYSLGATLYEAVTNRRPPDAPSRMVDDEMIPPGDAALSSYRPGFLSAIAKSLRLEVTERPRSVAEWRKELMAPVKPAARSQPTPAEPEPAGAADDPDEVAAPKAGKAGRPATAQPETRGARDAPSKASAKAAASEAYETTGDDGEPRQGLAGAFLAGWRKANPPTPDALVGAAVASPAAVPALAAAPAGAVKGKVTPAPGQPAANTPARAEAPEVPAKARRKLFRRAEAKPPAAPRPEPGARQATPRALRRRGGTRWRGLVAKLVLGLVVAGAAVAIQDKVPTVRREGAGLLTSQTGIDLALTRIKAHRASVTGLGFTQNGASLVSASADGTLKVWNAADGKLVRTFELDGGAATALAIREGRAATAHQDGSVAVFDLASGAKVASFKRGQSAIWAVTFTGDANHVAAAGDDGGVAFWDLGEPAGPIHVFEGHDGPARALAYAARGPFLASGSSDTQVKLWHLGKGELVRSYRGHGDRLAAVTFDPKGISLASADQDGQIRLWSTYSRRLKRRLRGHEGSVPALAFSPDGKLLISGGTDATIRIWDAANGKLRRLLEAGNGPVTVVSASPDGRRIAAAFADGAVRIFEASLGKAGS